MSLRPCSSCGRHVRHSESACPFCATALESIAERGPILLPRAGRAAIMAFGATLATAASGCPDTTGGDDAAMVGATDAAYGGPPFDAALDAAVADDARMMGGTDAAYGGAPDAPSFEDATADRDAAGDVDAGGIGPAYGGAP
ncbi:MAG: hypothetical protein K1X94_22750 [Sandaracinaceae bacterium]|nr:hypothetical protein [Sandaracinaceae bacterium]